MLRRRVHSGRVVAARVKGGLHGPPSNPGSQNPPRSQRFTVGPADFLSARPARRNNALRTCRQSRPATSHQNRKPASTPPADAGTPASRPPPSPSGPPSSTGSAREDQRAGEESRPRESTGVTFPDARGAQPQLPSRSAARRPASAWPPRLDAPVREKIPGRERGCGGPPFPVPTKISEREKAPARRGASSDRAGLSAGAGAVGRQRWRHLPPETTPPLRPLPRPC